MPRTEDALIYALVVNPSFPGVSIDFTATHKMDLASMTPEERIEKLGISLPQCSNPAANYTNAARTGNLLFLAGKAPLKDNDALPTGRLGVEYSTEQGYNFARSACLDLISVMKFELGELSNVAQVVELQGFVNASEGFEEHAQVLNGASDLLVQVFGDAGVHARSVFGASSLRGNVPIIIKGVIEFKPQAGDES